MRFEAVHKHCYESSRFYFKDLDVLILSFWPLMRTGFFQSENIHFPKKQNHLVFKEKYHYFFCDFSFIHSTNICVTAVSETFLGHQQNSSLVEFMLWWEKTNKLRTNDVFGVNLSTIKKN